MKTVLKIILAVLIFFLTVLLLLFVFLNCGFASKMAENLIEAGTGCSTSISGLRIKASVIPSVSLSVRADSVFLENGRDSLAIRVRGLKASAEMKRDSLLAGCSLERNFFRAGSNRIILNDVVLKAGRQRNDSLKYGACASLNIGGGKFISTLFPLKTRINAVSLTKVQDGISIDSLSVRSGTTDVSVSGAAGNLAGYLGGNGDMEVVLDIKSDNVNVNEILSGIYYGTTDVRTEYSPADEEDESFIEEDKYVSYPFIIKEIIPLILPERVNVSADLNVKKALVAILSMSDFSSHLDITDRTGKAAPCKFDSNFGKVSTTLFYSSLSRDSLYAGADLHLRGLQARRITSILPRIDGIAPVLRSFKGKFNCDATIITQVDTAFIPLPSTIVGVVNFKGHDMSITDAGDLRKYTSLLMFRNKNIGSISDVNLYSIISDSQIKVFPTLLGVDRYLLAMSGSHSFANVFDYDISVLKSPVPFRFGVSLHSDGGKSKSKVKFNLKKSTFRDAKIPTFYKEVNDAQKRLGSYIENVIDQGAVETKIKSAQITSDLLNRHKDIPQSNIVPADTAMTSSVRKYFSPASL